MQTIEQQSLSTPKKLILALQHMIAMFGATVLVPLLTGLPVSTALLSAGVGTLIFHFCTKGKVPVFLGSSFAFIPAIQLVAEAQGLQYAQGGIIVAGLIYVLLSLIVGKFGVERIIKYFPSQVIGPMIVVIGMNLLPTAVGMASNHYPTAILTFVIALTLSLKGKGFFKQLSIIIAIIIGYLVSLAFQMVDTSLVVQAPVFNLPPISAPKFSGAAIAAIAPVVLAVFMEHVGDISTNSAVVGQNFLKDPGLNRTLLGDGLATVFAGLIGGPPNTTYGENTGVLAITKNYDPSVLRMTAVFAIILATVGKVGAFLQSIPQGVMGGISVMLFGMIALVGVQTIRHSKMKLSVGNLIVMAVILIIGFGPSYGFPIALPITKTVSLQGLSLASIVGVILNVIFTKLGLSE